MSGSRQAISAEFGRTLNAALTRKFGRTLSAQRLADLFNLHAAGTTTISRETARKWLRAKSMPDYDHLSVLVRWLEVDPRSFIDTADTQADASFVKLRNAGPAVSRSIRQVQHIMEQLDAESAEALVVTARALQRLTNAKQS